MSKYSNKWTKDEADLAIKLSKEGLDSILISKAMYAAGYDRSSSGIRHFLQRTNRDNSVDRDNDIINNITSSLKKASNWPCSGWFDGPSHSADYTLCDTENGLDCWNALTDIETERQRLFNMITEEYAHIGNPKGKLFKVVSISDLHIPFVNDAVIKDMMEKHSDADILVVNGDLLEQYSVSKWPKSKGVVLKHEYQIAVKYIKMFASQFKKVVLTRGNHDERVAKYFASNIDPGISFLTHPDPLERISNGFDFTDTGEFKQIHSFDNVFYFGGLCGWYAKVGKTIFAHPSGGSGIPMRTGINVANYFLEKEDFDCVVLGHCFDEETELLTKDGWRTIDTINTWDEPATLNTETGKIEFNKNEGIYKYNNQNELVLFKNNVGLEIAVTPEHGMLYRTKHGVTDNTGWSKKNANEIEEYDRFAIPASGILDNNKDANISDAKLKLLAWIMTEGSIDTSSKNPNIRIYQSDDGSGFVKEIENLLKLENISFNKSLRYKAGSTEHGTHRNYDAYKFYIGVENSKILIPFLNLENKTLKHDFMMSLSLRQRKIIIEEMCKGDGSKCGTDRYCHYYTANKDLLNQFQTMCILSGIRAKANIKREDGTWVVSITETNIQTVLESERIKYSGRTWCLTVSNGTLIARRKGVPFFTQNTHKMGSIVFKGKLIIEQGCACIPMDYEADSKMQYGQQSFGYAVIYMNAKGEVDFDKSRPVYYGTATCVDTDVRLNVGD